MPALLNTREVNIGQQAESCLTPMICSDEIFLKFFVQSLDLVTQKFST
jgi:hypothetical protein